jgi:predicted nuclease of predicted toxin-antitoxin system
MIIWLDAHLPPSLAAWIQATFGVETHAVRDLGLRDARDPPIFQAAREANAVVMTKDGDFARMLERLGPPPKVLWVRCGNTSNASLREILSSELTAAVARLEGGESMVEIGNLN